MKITLHASNTFARTLAILSRGSRVRAHTRNTFESFEDWGYYTTTPLQHNTTTPLHHFTTTQLHYNYTTSILQLHHLHHYTTTPLHNYHFNTTTAPLHQFTTAPLRHYTTTQLHDYTTTPLTPHTLSHSVTHSLTHYTHKLKLTCSLYCDSIICSRWQFTFHSNYVKGKQCYREVAEKASKQPAPRLSSWRELNEWKTSQIFHCLLLLRIIHYIKRAKFSDQVLDLHQYKS